MGPVTPTLLITALGIVPDIRSTVSMENKKPGDAVYAVGETFNELGGSEYYKLKGYIGKNVPKVRGSQARKTFKKVTKAIDLGLVKACHDLSEGGLAVAAAEMALAGGFGVELDLRNVPRKIAERDDSVLFSESNSRFLVEIPENAKTEFEAVMKGRVCAEIGTVTKDSKLTVRGLNGAVTVDSSLADLRKSWKATLSSGVQET
jgi:phosphoribosylformylglycinamidine synthase